MEIGTVLISKWGWEQTNIDFYEVVKATEKTVTIRQIASKEDIDDFNNWLKHRPITEKLDDFFTFNILMPLTAFWYFIQIPFRGLKWWKKTK